MKIIYFIFLILFYFNLNAYDFELEILSSSDGNNTTIFNFSDNITYRHFHSFQNWKDNLGDWGTLECAGNHTIIKNKGTILKNYCKGTNQEGNIFWLVMDRNSVDFDAGVGKLLFRKGTGKFEKYDGVECVYAIKFSSNGLGSFQKAKCKYRKTDE